MNLGIFIDGRNPKSKKQIKEIVKAGELDRIEGYTTSQLGPSWGGPITELPPGRHSFVGPDPYSRRSFYGTVFMGADREVKVT